MSDILVILILFGTGLIAGVINIFAGGGSSLTLPVLIFLGLDSAAANGTNRVGVLLQNVSAVYSFKRENYHEFGTSLKLSLFTIPGAVAGALTAVEVGDQLFQTILGIIMIGIIIQMLFPNKKINYNDKPERIPWTAYFSMIFIGFYGGFIQVGIGFVLMAALHNLMKIKLVYVNMHKVFIVLLNTIPALIVFIITDNVNWFFGLSLAGGNALGGWWAAKMHVKKGEGLIKIMLVIAILIMALKLLNIF